MTARPVSLPAYGVFAALLAAAGLPIYIHAPKAYVDDYGVSLAALGAVLFGLRLLDVVQDPLLGRLAGLLRHQRALAVTFGVTLMVICMLGLFAITPPIAPLVWFAIMLAGVFSAFSFLTICFYAQGVQTADRLAGKGHLRLARWRETGALLGVCVAAVMPVVLNGFAGFALGFAVLGVTALWLMRAEWSSEGDIPEAGFAPVLKDSVARRLLLIALFNAAPVAVSSTLFLFFVESRLDAPGWEGPFLLLFFLSAAVAAPFWGRLAEIYGPKRVLLAAMVLAILAFGFAITLGAGDTWAFAVICVVSGAALGADLTILPAIFASRMAKIAPGAAGGFGLWSFVSKLSLAFAAIALLPALEMAGFRAGTDNSDSALWALSLAYGMVPCILKLLAIGLLATTTWKEE